MALERNREGLGLKKIYSKVSADNAEDLIFRNHALFELGQLYLEKCDFPNAVDCFEKVKTEALQFHLYDNYFRSINYLLRIHAERLEFDKHESLMREVLQVGASLASHEKYLPKFHYNQGIAANYRRDFEGAKNEFQVALALAENLLKSESLTGKNREDVIRDMLSLKYSLAITEKDLKRPQEALNLLKKLQSEIDELHQDAHAL